MAAQKGKLVLLKADIALARQDVYKAQFWLRSALSQATQPRQKREALQLLAVYFARYARRDPPHEQAHEQPDERKARS